MRRRLVGLLLVGVLGLGAVAAACEDSRRVERAPEEPVSQISAPRSGAQIYASTCATCHGQRGEGADQWRVRDEDGRLPPPPLNGDGHTWHHPDGVLYRIVSEGGAGIGFGSNMPSFKDELTPEEIVAVLEYVKTLWEGKEIDGVSLIETQREFSVIDPFPVDGE